jgi:hypothetical protein
MADQKLNQEKVLTEEKEIETKLKNYTGPEGIATRDLEIGLWYVEHKRQMMMLLYGFLIIVGAISWAYTIYGFAYYLAVGMNQDEILAKQLVETKAIGHDYVLGVGAKDLSISQAEILKSANKKYDLAAQIRNDNQSWWAEFDFYFITPGFETKIMDGYILPRETKYFFALAQESINFPQDAQLVLENLRWHRLNPHQIPEWDVYYKEHLNIESTDIKFTPASQSLISEKLNLNQLSFNVINNTAFNYWQTGFTILLYSGGGLVDINHYLLDNFMSGQKRSVEISWTADLGRVDKIEIVPEINIMKDDIYIKYEGGVGQEK